MMKQYQLVHPNNGAPPPQPLDLDFEAVVSISTIFFPGNLEGGVAPDTVISSTDDVHFYFCLRAIRDFAPTAFNAILPIGENSQTEMGPIIQAPDDSITLTIILQALYGLSPAHMAPSLEDVEHAIERMPPNGLDPKTLIAPDTPFYNLLLEQAPLQPMKVYTIAAQNDMEALARRSSSHLLGYRLDSIDDVIATKIGAVYLVRLYVLQEERLQAMKNLIIQPPSLHSPTKMCSLENQSRLHTEWGLCIVTVLKEANAGISPFALCRSFDYGLRNVTCVYCRKAWSDRLEDISKAWAAVKHSI